MNQHLRNLIHQHRESKGIKVGKMSEMLGYRNISKGSNKILRFEREGLASNELIQKLIDVLGVEPLEVQRALQEDYQDWQAWLDEPVEIELILKHKSAVYQRVEIPAEIEGSEETTKNASEIAKKNHFEACLALNRRESVWIRADGTIKFKTTAKYGFPNIPYTGIGNKKFHFG